MDFRHLTDAECGQANPLAQLSSHITHDRTFGDTHGQVFPSSSDQLVEQFLQETRAIPQTFRMDDLMREMHEIESQKSALPPVPASAVKEHLHDNEWAQQYIEDGKVFNDNMSHENIWAEISSREQNIGVLIQENWEEQLLASLQPGPSETQKSAKELLNAVDDPKFVYSKFMNFMKHVEEGDLDLESGKLTEKEAQIWSEEFINHPEKDDISQSWVNEHTAEADAFNSDYWDTFQEQMKQVVENEEFSDHPWLSEFSEYSDSSQKDYVFSEENPMFDINNPLDRGKQLLEEGDLPSAVLCFEAAVTKEPTNGEAWFLLGRTQAENEQDPCAIPALKRCLQIDPKNSSALMSLAVSYTNESYFNQACETLITWLKNNPKYADLVSSDFKLSGQVTSLLNANRTKMVQDIYIRAAQRQPVDIDYEIQCGLGVLFNLSGHYDKAADCFKAALSVKPDDARLWNRLGATLANGTRPEEAVDAYHHALNISPGFIRARYNVGITCINLNAYKEAAEHFLTALNQQARGRDITNSGTISQMSDTIWSTLKMCISLMNRTDLKPAIENRDLKTLNKVLDVSEN